MKYIKYLADAHKKIDGTYGEITIEYCYLAGCTGILDITTGSSVFGNCGRNYTIENVFAKEVIDNETMKLDLSDQTLTRTEFGKLEDKPNLQYLSLTGINITEDNGDSISDADKNELVNSVLDTCTKLSHVTLENLSWLTTIEWVAGKDGLRELGVAGTKVTTGTVDDSGNYTGLDLLNDNCPRFVNLRVNTSTVNFVNIQPALNKLYNEYYTAEGIMRENEEIQENIKTGDGRYWIVDSSQVGLRCSNTTALKTLEDCTDLKILKLTKSSYGNNTLNLERCVSLEDCYVIYGKCVMKLPRNIKRFGNDSSGGYLCDFSLCEQLTYLDLWNQYGNQDAFDNIVSDLVTCTPLEEVILDRFYIKDLSALSTWNNKDNLKNLKLWDDFGRYYFDANQAYTGNYFTFTSLEGLETLSNIETLTIGFVYPKDAQNKLINLDISAIKDLTNLKNLTIDHARVKDISYLSKLNNIENLNLRGNFIDDISSLSGMTKMKEMNLSINKISSLKALENMKDLETLNLENNVLYDYGYYQESGISKSCNNMAILGDLNLNGHLRNLFIKENFFENFSILNESSMNWEKTNGWERGE